MTIFEFNNNIWEFVCKLGIHNPQYSLYLRSIINVSSAVFLLSLHCKLIHFEIYLPRILMSVYIAT